MDQQEWNKIEHIVDAAQQLKGKERTRYIQEQCADNPDLKYQVTRLLKAIDKSGSEDFLGDTGEFMGQLADDITQKKERSYASSLIGETIGRYKITELIGHGGMGSVFLANRADDAYHQEVALKIMRRGMETPSNVARFRRERNILARLDHPNIARLLDGGVTPDGLPYLVMEYVEGVPLLKYCDSHKLSTEKRLSLFKSICKAVQSAHRNATIHRDLKPSNICVTDEGSVKVLDFGIAKLLEPANPETTLFQTQTGTRMLTLGYAAPEQIENKAITTATDSFTLGILLYKLLAGCHPFDLKDKDLPAIEDLIRNHNQPKPSVRFSGLPEAKKTAIASKHSTSPSSLAQDLTGDLDAIAMKALRKEPGSRYPSVEQLLEDLNRYEKSLPLIAQSDTLKYRVGKFIRRHRNAVVGILLLLVSVAALGSYHFNRVTKERNIAKEEAQKAASVKDFLINIFRSSNPKTADFDGKNLSARQLLISGKSVIKKDLEGQPDAYTEVLLAIGDALESIDAFDDAQNSYQMMLTKAPNTSHPLKNKVRAYVKLADLLLTRTQPNQGRRYLRKAQKILDTMDNPSTNLRASVKACLGKLHNMTNNYKKSKHFFQQADSLYTKLEPNMSLAYLDMLTWYGRSLLWNADFQQAIKVLQQSNDLHHKRYSKPTLTIAENYHMMAWGNRDLSNFKLSNKYFHKAIKMKSKLAGPESFTTARSLYHLSRNYVLMGKAEKSEQYVRRALNIFKKQADSLNGFIRRSKNYLSIALCHQNKLSEAKELFQEIIQQAAKNEGQNTNAVAYPSAQLATVYHKKGQFEKAVPLLKKAIATNKQIRGEKSRAVGVDMNLLAAVYRDMEKYELAEQYFHQVKSIYEKELPEKHYRKAQFYVEFGKFKRETDHPQEARKYFRKAHNFYRKSFGEDNELTKKTSSYLEQIAQT